MLYLSTDESFHYELLRVLSHARYFGSDVGEVLEAASRIEAGNLESFYDIFNKLALRVNSQAEQIDASKNPVSARDAYFRASNYFRSADFYLHGRAEDPRIKDLWKKQTVTFDKAIALLPIPGKRLLLKGEGFNIPAIFYAAAGDRSTPKPTLVMGNGYDGAQEEMLHVFGFAALERGYNVITYEGPGQPTVLRDQNLGFIVDWEKAVSPVLDHLGTLPEVDTARVGLIGYSMGGWLAVRAGAFEHRLAAVIAIDGVYDVFQAFSNVLPSQMRTLLDSEDRNAFDTAIRGVLASGTAPTTVRWGIEQGLWSFGVQSATDFMNKARKMTLKGIADRIQCPVLVGEAENDMFFKGQPRLVKEALGEKATFLKLTDDEAAGNHCHVGAAVLMNQLVFDWFETIVSKSKNN